jgi:sigma-E factor negative regulatory protein RseC
MSKNIQHKGRVESIEGDKVRVLVAQQSACAGCHAKGICGEKGMERIIEVTTPYAANFEVGERVIVALINNSMAFSSVVWGYVLPLIVLLVALFGSKALEFEDGTSAIISLCSVAAYYFGLYLGKNKIDKKIEFTIIKE